MTRCAPVPALDPAWLPALRLTLLVGLATTVGCGDLESGEVKSLEQNNTHSKVQITSAPTLLTAGSDHAPTVSFSAAESGFLQIRFFSPNHSKLVENHVSVSAGQGERNIRIALPASVPAGSGYYWEAILFNSNWRGKASHKLTGVTVGTAVVQGTGTNSVQLTSAPKTVVPGSSHLSTVSYSATNDGFLQVRFFNANHSKLAENHASVSAGSGSKSISVTVPSSTPGGSGYYWEAMLFNSNWSGQASHKLTGVVVGTGVNSVQITSAPSGVTPGSSHSPTVSYSAAESGLLQLRFLSPGSMMLAMAEVTVSAGSQSRNISLTVPANTPGGSGYYWQAKLQTPARVDLASHDFTGVTVTTAAGAVPVGRNGNWTAVWGDEFNGVSLDRSRWTPNYYWGARFATEATPTAHSHDTRAAAFDPAQVQVSGGTLKIRGEAVPGGISAVRDNGSTATYFKRSGIVSSHDTFSIKPAAGQRIYIEARMKMPDDKGGKKGVWPAFWTLSADRGWLGGDSRPSWPTEMDIVEWDSEMPTAHWTNYWWRDNLDDPSSPIRDKWSVGKGGAWYGHNGSSRFTVYGAEWTTTSIRYFIDGQQVKSFNTSEGVVIPNERMFFMISMELLAGQFLRGAAEEVDPALLPAVLEVDYVRAWTAPLP